MSNPFWQGETYAIAKMIKAAGNQPGIVQRWVERVAEWADLMMTPTDAAAVRAWLPFWQNRPFYTPEELAPIWPALAIMAGKTTRFPAVLKSPMRLRFEMDYAGIESFERFGKRFYIVERPHYWRGLIERAEWEEIDRLILGE